MNLKPFLFTFPFLITGCTVLDYHGYSHTTKYTPFPEKVEAPFLFCGNKFFQSDLFIYYLNKQNSNFSPEVTRITAVQNPQGLNYNNAVESPMSCKATFTYEDNHKESVLMTVQVKSIPRENDNFTFFGDQLGIHWLTAADLAEQAASKAERDKKIKKLKERIAYEEKNMKYICNDKTEYASGKIVTTSYSVSTPAECGNLPYVVDDRTVESLKDELWELKNR